MKKDLFFKRVALFILSIFLLTSCGLPAPGTPLTPEQREQAKNQCIGQYIAGGAILGGIAGALIGGRERRGAGAVIGALAGGALAYIIAYGKCIAYFSDLNTFPVAGYQETARKERYSPEQGDVVKIKHFAIVPREVDLGGKARLEGEYYILSPKELKEVKVKETRTLYYFHPEEKKWIEIGSVANEIVAELSTRKAEGNIDVLKDLPEGSRCRLDFKIAALGKEDVASAEFVLKKSTAIEKILNFFAFKNSD